MPRLPKHPYLVAWLSWLAISCLLVLACFPRIRDAYRKSEVGEMLATRANEQVGSDYRQVSVFFVDSRLKPVSFPQRQKRLGGDLYHDTLENLLAGPESASVKKGAATFIAFGTKLIGCTLSCRTLFVDLSKKVLDSPDLDMALEQISMTMLAFSSVDRIQILVEGKPISELLKK